MESKKRELRTRRAMDDRYNDASFLAMLAKASIAYKSLQLKYTLFVNIFFVDFVFFFIKEGNLQQNAVSILDKMYINLN